LKGQLRIALRARARDDVEAGYLQKLFFERRRDVVRHRHRIRARIRTRDLDDRIIDRGQIVDGEFVVSGNAGNDDRQRQQHSHYRPADEGTGKS